MKKVICFLLLFSIGRVYGQAFNDYANAGVVAERQNNYREAVNQYLNAYRLSSSNPQLTREIGLMYYYLQKFDSAIVFYNEVLSQNPKDTESLFYRANCYLYSSQPQQALDDFLTYSKLTKKVNSFVVFDIGRCYEALGDFDAAIDHFNRVLTFRPYDKNSFYELGYCYTLKFDKFNAMKFYNKAIAQDPDYYLAYLNRGLLFESQFKNIAKAHQDFERSIAIKPNDRLSYLYEGELFNDQHQFTQAKDIFDKVLGMYPDFAEAYCERAISLSGLGDVSAACTDLDEAQKLGCAKAAEYRKNICK